MTQNVEVKTFTLPAVHSEGAYRAICEAQDAFHAHLRQLFKERFADALLTEFVEMPELASLEVEYETEEEFTDSGDTYRRIDLIVTGKDAQGEDVSEGMGDLDAFNDISAGWLFNGATLNRDEVVQEVNGEVKPKITIAALVALLDSRVPNN